MVSPSLSCRRECRWENDERPSATENGRFGGTDPDGPVLQANSDAATYHMIYSVSDSDVPAHTDTEDRDAIRFVVRIVRDPSQITDPPTTPDGETTEPGPGELAGIMVAYDGISEGEVAAREMPEVMPKFVPSTDDNNRYEVMVPTNISVVDISVVASSTVLDGLQIEVEMRGDTQSQFAQPTQTVGADTATSTHTWPGQKIKRQERDEARRYPTSTPS